MQSSRPGSCLTGPIDGFDDVARPAHPRRGGFGTIAVGGGDLARAATGTPVDPDRAADGDRDLVVGVC
jgi:hypothetical protein